MILPIIGQECVVTYRDALHLAKVTRAYVNHLGQWRISVHGAWGYAIDFKASAVKLVPLQYGISSVHDEQAAVEAFHRRYDSAAQMAMLDAEKSAPPAKPVPPPPPPPPARQVHDGVAAAVRQGVKRLVRR